MRARSKLDDAIAWYESHSAQLAERYEALRFEDVHGWLLPQLPEPPGAVLDVGAGSGRDAAWFAERGFEVVAAEPSSAFFQSARRRHASDRIRWLHDSLPALARVGRLGLSFDVVLVSAVWMHVAPSERRRALRKLLEVLKPGGVLALTLRHGPAEPERGMHEVSSDELERLARELGAFVFHRDEAPDALGRSHIRWSQIAITLPDDGTGALPLIRHIVLNDEKASTYKLGLLRTLCRIADSAQGMTVDHGDDTVSIPLGLVGLYWLRLFKPLIEADLRQMPTNRDGRGPGFVKADFRALASTSPLDLRVGMRFADERAKTLQRAVRECVHTISRMPVHYITHADGQQVMTARQRRTRIKDAVTLDYPYFASLGELRVPRHLWRAMMRFDCWIEPAVVAEWIKLIRDFSGAVDEVAIRQALAWSDPARDARRARQRAQALMASGQALYCVWSGKRLPPATLDMDHCFPWTVWPCDGHWNLLPASPRKNREKGARLPSAGRLLDARERIEHWWHTAYAGSEHGLSDAFFTEARAALPLVTEDTLEQVFEGLMAQRMRLREDQQVPEW